MNCQKQIYTIDLHFLDTPNVIASFLLRDGEDLALVETGPYSTYPILEREIGNLGFRIEDIKHVFLTHIHFDHAGAAWALATQGATLYVHPVGAPHLVQPERLVKSATRIYGDQMDVLWGEMRPIAEERIQIMEHGQSVVFGSGLLRAWHTPGHAKHHIAWQWNENLFCGDVAGIKIEDGPVMPPCPPPDIDLPAWKKSIAFCSAQPAVEKLWLTHFGMSTGEVQSHWQELEKYLDEWAYWVKSKMEAGQSAAEMVPSFQKFVANQLSEIGLSPQAQAKYEGANPAFMSVSGLMRYWQKAQEQK